MKHRGIGQLERPVWEDGYGNYSYDRYAAVCIVGVLGRVVKSHGPA